MIVEGKLLAIDPNAIIIEIKASGEYLLQLEILFHFFVFGFFVACELKYEKQYGVNNLSNGNLCEKLPFTKSYCSTYIYKFF